MNALAYSYRRFSAPAQRTGDSLRRQSEQRDAWLARNPSITLDTSLAMTDEGLSGFDGTNLDVGCLSEFLRLVASGDVQRGSYLIVESLDRLSREHVQRGLNLCLNILAAGIRIVQLCPAEIVYDDRSDAMHLMMMIMELSRGNSESQMKSERVGKAWRNKKEHAHEVAVSSRCPTWLRLDNLSVCPPECFQFIPERAQVVKRMFSLANEGNGVVSICRILNKEGVANWGRRSKSKQWGQSTVYCILTSKTAIGEYQPHVGNRKSRQPIGDSVKNYYPAVVSEEVFYSVQNAIAKRKVKGAGRKSLHVNLFSGLLVDARDNGTIHATRCKCKPSYYAGSNAKTGIAGSVWSCFPLEVFDNAILSQLKEVKLSAHKEVNNLDALNGQLQEVDGRILKLKSLLKTSDNLDVVVETIAELTQDKKTLQASIQEALARATSTPQKDMQELHKAIASEDRARVAWAIRKVVREIRCLFVGGRGEDRLASVEVYFHNNEHVRSYLIHYRPQRSNGKGAGRKTVPASVFVQTVKYEGNAPLETYLRNMLKELKVKA